MSKSFFGAGGALAKKKLAEAEALAAQQAVEAVESTTNPQEETSTDNIPDQAFQEHAAQINSGKSKQSLKAS